jgi:hypothetical protein
MKTYYSDDEIDALVNEVKTAFLKPAFDLAKSEGKKVPTSKEGGNGTEPQAEVKLEQGDGERANTIKQGQPSKSGKGTPSIMTKAGPAPEEAQAESPEASSAAPAGPSDASPASADPAQSAPPADAGAPDAMQDPAAGGAEGGPEGAHSPEDIKAAYESLDDEGLKLHYEALKAVLMERMGGGQGAEQAPEQAAPEQTPPPEAAPQQSAPPQSAPAMKSEELSKAEAKIEELSKSLTEVLDMVTKLASQPRPKAITEISQLSKSEVAQDKLTKDQVESKLLQKAKDQALMKSDRALIVRYFTPNNTVKFEEIAHLLK